MFRRSSAALGAAAVLATIAAAPASAALPPISKAPSTTTDPYVLPVAPGVHTQSLLTTGDSVGGVKMAGIPDGLGAFAQDGGSFGLLMNHELPNTAGNVRAHGQNGAFVSKWSIDRRSHAVTAGSDLIQPGVKYWDYRSRAYVASSDLLPGLVNPDGSFNTFSPAFARFCSATLSAPGQFYNRRSGRGTESPLYFANEENGDEGRVFGVTLDGQAQQLPRLGLFSWENSVPADTRSDRTLVVGNEDGGAGQLWIYRGTKRATGNDFDKAGLTNGSSYVVNVPGAPNDAKFRQDHPKGQEVPFDINQIDWNSSGKQQNAEAVADGIALNRVEDGAWDPRHANDFYFVTTEGAPRPDGSDGGGLWRLRFEDLNEPELGGTLTRLLDGNESWGTGQPGAYKPDNLEIDRDGNLLIQEDPGGADHVARILAYDISTGARGVVAKFDPKQFTPGQPKFITNDEESSGIIDARSFLGRGWYVFDAQVHKTISPDPDGLVQMGQLMLLKVDDFDYIYGNSGAKDRHVDDESDDEGRGGDS
ncbi:MAG TPA: hypothetical protein VK501_04630 [Baekduia sp.]|uniref:hypothetical protein n=1 Tax=Baekduia sp. TaxID=2600305 RepID=UPI002B693E9D|nr:hypothetical protein [Baekduia sp.]HMJ33182.1 hypothetical protein [Baekduia sp.]